MKQFEAVIQTLDKLGGQATLVELYHQVMKVENCEWKTKTPFASIRRIVQTRPEIFKVRPGLWALRSYQKKLGLEEQDKSEEAKNNSHYYYQGVLATIGNLRGYATFIPNQDKSRLFVNRPLGTVRSLDEIPHFTHDALVNRSKTIDVIWFNERQMPHSFFEVEHSTDIKNSLLKFYDLQDFSSQMIVVADKNRNREFDDKLQFSAFSKIKNRVMFLNYDTLVKQYEYEVLKTSQAFSL
ncbi:MAG: hypothetical protein ABI904_14455 [Chloroflexota bacterium]